jgi:hypothetical protein
VIKVVIVRLDDDVVGRQPNVWVGAAIVLLDVGLEVVGVGDRLEMWRQCGKGSDRHVVAVVADLSRDVALHCSHDLRSKLTVRVGHRTLRMAVVCLMLGKPLVLDVMAVVFLALHDPMDGARGAVLAIVVEVTSELSLFALVVALVAVATSVATTLILVEVGA